MASKQRKTFRPTLRDRPINKRAEGLNKRGKESSNSLMG